MMARPLVIAIALTLAAGALGCAEAAPPTIQYGSEREAGEEEGSRDVDVRTTAVIAFAEAQVGKRYCWGGTGPRCFDCSGLVQSAWRSGGVTLPRTSTAQGHALMEVPRDQIRPGDILWWPTHVGLYIGRGEMIDAYHSGAGVVRRRAANPSRVLRVNI